MVQLGSNLGPFNHLYTPAYVVPLTFSHPTTSSTFSSPASSSPCFRRSRPRARRERSGKTYTSPQTQHPSPLLNPPNLQVDVISMSKLRGFLWSTRNQPNKQNADHNKGKNIELKNPCSWSKNCHKTGFWGIWDMGAKEWRSWASTEMNEVRIRKIHLVKGFLSSWCFNVC